MFESTLAYCRNIDGLILHLKNDNSAIDFLKDVSRRYPRDSQIHSEVLNYLEGVGFPQVASAKRFTYCNSIISLYGYLENFLENIVKEFVVALNDLNAPFSNLPRVMRDAHLESSIDLLRKIQRNRAVSKDLKLEAIRSVVSNMNSCVQESDCYKLNEGAYSIHSANFRYGIIHELFCKIGIQGLPRKALMDSDFQTVISGKYALDSMPEQKSLVSLLTAELDDLAQRRNEIAHGSFDGELESVDLLVERALLLKAFGSAVGSVVFDYYNELSFSAFKGAVVGLPDRVFNNINVVGFKGLPGAVPEFNISVGDKVFSYNINSSVVLKCGSIVSLCCGSEAVSDLNFPSAIDFSVKVDFGLGAHEGNREFFCVSKKL